MKKTNLYHINFKQNQNAKKTNTKKAKIISMLVYCQVCKKETTKKNKIDNHYVCSCCKNSSLNSKYKDVPKYVNWDGDLEFLYNHVWLDDTK